jgi:hypothetical protein
MRVFHVANRCRLRVRLPQANARISIHQWIKFLNEGIAGAPPPYQQDPAHHMGPAIAQAIVSKNISCVIATFGMPKVAQRHLIAEFAEELLRINNTPRHVFVEEAHEYVPQRIMPGAGMTFAAVEALVTMGRNRGIGVTMLNQRAATLNKDVLSQIDTLLALRSVGPQDRDALQAWVEYQEADGDLNKFITSLPSLKTGTGWIDKLLRELANPNRHDIPTNLPFRVEMWDRHDQHIRWVVAASTSVAIGHAALDMAIATYPSERFTLRNGTLVIRQHPPQTAASHPE